MGHWGPGILDDDVAEEVRIQFDQYRKEGQRIAEAARRVLEDPPAGFDDEEDTAVTYLALAALQLDQGDLDPIIRDKSLEIIASGVPLWRWEGSAPERLADRVRVLEEFRTRLLDCLQS